MYVLSFNESDAMDIGRVGGKGANLAILTGAGFPVPPGFCVTARAYGEFVAADDLGRRVVEMITGAGELKAIDNLSAEARGMLTRQAIPEGILAAIRDAYVRLGDDVQVAVRSSATAEDLPEASFAGQQDTYLNVQGLDDLTEHVRQCWASLWTARAVTYRQEHGFDHESVALAVVVQEMIEPAAAGVLFTANPVTGRRDESVVNSSWGLGESVVSGLVTPDTFVVHTETGQIRDRTIGDKLVEIVYGADGHVEERGVEEPRASQPSLTDEQLRSLAQLGAAVQTHYGSPQDIEWAVKDGELYLLQSRPITTLGPSLDVDPSDHWTRAMFEEILPDAPSPVFCSVLEPMLTHMLDFTFRRLGQAPAEDIPAIGVFYHQPYLNVRYISQSLSGLPTAARESLTERIANPFSSEEAAEEASGSSLSPATIALAWRLLTAARTLPDEVPQVVSRYYEQLEVHRSRDPGDLPSDQVAGAIEDISYNVLPPLVAYDFLLIAALGFVHRLTDSELKRSGIPEPDSARGSLSSGITGNLTMETNKELWRLADVARHSDGVAAAIEVGPDDDLVDRIGSTPGGEQFLAELERFLDSYGHREIRMDIAFPTWGEDPAPVLQFVRAYLAADNSTDPADQEREMAAKRREVAGAIDSGLSESISGRLVHRRLFHWALDKAEALSRDRDTMHFHWTASFPVLRAYLHELAGRWVDEGILDSVHDIHCLTLHDIRDLVEEPGPAQKQAADQCRAWHRDDGMQWPTEIVEGREVYAAHESLHEGGDDMLSGIAGSPGRATGTVRIIMGPEDFGRLEAGDVLVAPITNPVWTPLFAVAGAVVTDSGGILSHGAIVAREYGIPAVMGVRGATKTLRDGQTVVVDGVNGTVAIEE